LQQHGTLSEINNAFDAISCKFCLSEDYLVDAYLAGLQDEYVNPVRLFKPRTMREACSLAQEINLRQDDERKMATKNMSFMAPGSNNTIESTQDNRKSIKNAIVESESQPKEKSAAGTINRIVFPPKNSSRTLKALTVEEVDHRA